MEHRWRKRTRINRPVRIYQQGIPVAVGNAANINQEGLYIAMEQPGMQPGDKIDIEFVPTTRSANESGEPKVSGLVIHKSHDGCGVMFRFVERDLLQRIQEPYRSRTAAN
jgi:hypothetical protein